MSERVSSCLTFETTAELEHRPLSLRQPVPAALYLQHGAEHIELQLSMLWNLEANHPSLTALD